MLTLRIISINPPPDTYQGQNTIFGLQDKSGEVKSGEAREDGSLVFTCEVDVKPNGSMTSPFLHGSPKDRFLYLSYGYAPGEWIKRIKVLLNTVTPEMLQTAVERQATLEARVDGAGAATVELLGDGWTLL
jgi:hypothetical protein